MAQLPPKPAWVGASKDVNIHNQTLQDRIGGSLQQGLKGTQGTGGMRATNVAKGPGLKGKGREEQIEPFAPWFDASTVREDVSREDRLHDEVAALVTYLSPRPAEIEARRLLVEHLTSLVRARWQDAQVTLFGSGATGLGLPWGDLDIVISFDPARGRELADKRGIVRRLRAIEDEFRRARVIADFSTRRVFHARVPIISFTTTAALGSFHVDISVQNPEDSGPRAIPLIRGFSESMPALRALVLILKAYLGPRGLNNAAQSSLSSYALTLLCISFLQRNPTSLPSTSLSAPMETHSFGILLRDFLHYYSHQFPYATHYISVSAEDVFPKKDQGWEDKSSRPMLSVQCILNPDKNITSGCSRIREVLDAFGEGADVLQDLHFISNKPLLGTLINISRENHDAREALATSLASGEFQAAVFTPPPAAASSFSRNAPLPPHPSVHSLSGRSLANRIGRYGAPLSGGVLMSGGADRRRNDGQRPYQIPTRQEREKDHIVVHRHHQFRPGPYYERPNR